LPRSYPFFYGLTQLLIISVGALLLFLQDRQYLWASATEDAVLLQRKAFKMWLSALQ